MEGRIDRVGGGGEGWLLSMHNYIYMYMYIVRYPVTEGVEIHVPCQENGSLSEYDLHMFHVTTTNPPPQWLPSPSPPP